jgi:hypothetical protein
MVRVLKAFLIATAMAWGGGFKFGDWWENFWEIMKR